MNKTFKKIFSVCCAVVTTLTATLFHSTNLKAKCQKQHIVFVGPEQAGKTKLISGICGNSYNSDYAATIDTDFFSVSRLLTLWDTSGNTRFFGFIGNSLKFKQLCVLSISNTSQDTGNFLNSIAKNNVPNVVLCITKTDEGTPASEEVSSLLGTVKDKFSGVTGVRVFDEVLYTSAQKNTFKFCTPDECNTSEEYQIYDTEKNEKVLAAKLYELCGGKAKDFQDAIYRQTVSSGNSGYKAHFQNGTSKKDYSSESNSEYDNSHIGLCNSDTLQEDYLRQSSSTEKPPTSKAKKQALKFGIPAVLLTLISGIGYYEYDRHFRKQEKTKTKTKSEQTPKVNRKISS